MNDGGVIEQLLSTDSGDVSKQIEQLLKSELAAKMNDGGVIEQLLSTDSGDVSKQIEQLLKSELAAKINDGDVSKQIEEKANEMAVTAEEKFNTEMVDAKTRQEYELKEKPVEVLDKIGNFEMCLDTSLRYLHLQSNLQSVANTVQPLAESAKQFLRSRYNDVTKCSEEILGLPIAAFEAVLANDGLRAPCEDIVLDLVLKYIRTHYPSIEERQNVLINRLCPLIRFQYLSRRKFKSVLNCPEFSPEPMYKAVVDSYLTSDMTPRTYTEISFVVRSFELSQPRCEVNMKLKRDACANLFPDGKLYSKTFHLDGHTFFFKAACEQNGRYCFGLSLFMIGMESEICHVQYKFSVIAKPSEDFEDLFQGTHSFIGKNGVCVRNLMNLAWAEFIAVDSKYFVADIMYLKAELIVKKDPQQN